MNWPRPEVLALVVPFVVTVVLTAVLRRVAPALGLIDKPDPRKVHTTPTPRAGGLAIFAAVLVAFPWHPATVGYLPFPTLLALAAVIVVLGLVDDLRPLPWSFRLGVQAVVAAAIVWDAPGLDFPGGRFLAGVWLVAMINAFNFLDNMDALSAGTAWIVALMFFLLAILGGDDGRLELIVLGATAGFLVHNYPPARIFMGDAGSTLLGLLVGVLGLELVTSDRSGEPLWGRVWVVLLVCAVPVYDQASVVLLRLSQGRSPFHPDKQHLSHRIADRGWSKPAAVAWIHALGLASGACGVLLYSWPPHAALPVALLATAGWLSLALYEFGPRRRRT